MKPEQIFKIFFGQTPIEGTEIKNDKDEVVKGKYKCLICEKHGKQTSLSFSKGAGYTAAGTHVNSRHENELKDYISKQ